MEKSNTKQKKAKIQHRQKPLKRQNTRRRGTISNASQASATRSSSTLQRLTAGASKRKAVHDSQGRNAERRTRAGAISRSTATAQRIVSKAPSLKRASASRNVNKVNRLAKNLATNGKPKRDFSTGRTLFPTDGADGKRRYLPIEGEATAMERKLGLFVNNDLVKKDPVNTLFGDKSIRDFNTDRTLFATENTTGKREFLPKESEATALELSLGKYIANNEVEVPPVGNTLLEKSPLFEFSNQRNLYATLAEDGSTEYLPKQSNATATELQTGRYIPDQNISKQESLGLANTLSNNKPRYDIGKERMLYAINTKEGGTRYLARESNASALELAKGLYIPDDVVDSHEKQRRNTASKGSNEKAKHALRRAQRAARLHGSVSKDNINSQPKPVIKATDGTAIWDGSTAPQISDERQREVLNKLKPKYDLTHGRMLFPAEAVKGKIFYLPLLEDASNGERIRGDYLAFVPREPLEEFINHQLDRKTLDTDSGEISAYLQEDIEQIFENAPTLVLRSANRVEEIARQTPQLHQIWPDP